MRTSLIASFALSALTATAFAAPARSFDPVRAPKSSQPAARRAYTGGLHQLRVRDPRSRPPQIASYNLDWDDNTVFMPTKIWLKNDKTGKEVGVSTADWAIARGSFPFQDGKLVGNGKYQGYSVDLDNKTGGFRDFYDQPGKNQFLTDLKSVVEKGGTAWQGPSWKAFVTAMQRPDTARRTSFITARGHSRDSIYQALQYLQKKGFVNYLPPKQNLFAVQNPDFVINGMSLAGGTSSSELKTQVMKKLLDQEEVNGFGRKAVNVITPDGKGRKKLQLWGFSDDDFGNFDTAVKNLSAEVKAGRWPDVKISLFFTGKNNPTEKPHTVVITPDGTLRPQLPGERAEVAQMFGARH